MKGDIITSERIIALEDTVELMNGEDYRERFVAEYKQLVIRFKAMADYIAVLEARAVMEGIEL